MGERDWLEERFEGHRRRLQVVAYRILGSWSEAEDAVQETWLRLNRSGTNVVCARLKATDPGSDQSTPCGVPGPFGRRIRAWRNHGGPIGLGAGASGS